MSKAPAQKFEKLEDSKAWREACDLAEYMYGILHILKEHGEEFGVGSKIRWAADDLMFYTGLAVGNGTPAGAESEWGNARKHLGALKTLYRFAGRQHFLEIDPEIMVRLDKLNALVDSELEKAAERTKAANEQQLNIWREEYSIWRKMNEDPHPKPRKAKA